MNGLFLNFYLVITVILNRFSETGMRRMSRSLNASIISLVIRPVSEFNLTVTKTPDTSEEYPTNWPTYWFVFQSPNRKIPPRFSRKIISFIFTVISHCEIHSLLPDHSLFEIFHHDLPIGTIEAMDYLELVKIVWYFENCPRPKRSHRPTGNKIRFHNFSHIQVPNRIFVTKLHLRRCLNGV